MAMRCSLCRSPQPSVPPTTTPLERGRKALLFLSQLKGPPSLPPSLDLSALAARLQEEERNPPFCLTCWDLIEEGQRRMEELNGTIRKLQSRLEAAAAVFGSALQESPLTAKTDQRKRQTRLEATAAVSASAPQDVSMTMTVEAEPWSIFPDLKEEPEEELDLPDQEEPFDFAFAISPDPLKPEPYDVSNNHSEDGDSFHTTGSSKGLLDDEDPHFLNITDLRVTYTKRRSCPLCPKDTRSRTYLTAGVVYLSHLERAHPDQVLKCRICEKLLLNSKDILEAHDQVHDQGSLTCNICGLTPTSEAAHYVHLFMVHFVPLPDPRPKKRPAPASLECEECHLTFSDRRKFRVHQQNHQRKEKNSNNNKERKQVPCPIPSCGKLVSQRALKKHLIAHDLDPDLEKVFKCSACPATFASEYSLNRHSLTHEDLLPPGKRKLFECPQCLGSFNSQERLDKHSSEANCGNGKKARMSCAGKGCEFMTASFGALKMHERRSHPELMVHSCHVCGKTYTTPDFLEVHMVSHEEGPYSCNLCMKRGYPFADKEEFETHLAIHNGEKTIKCPDCSELFLIASHLLAHQVRVHNSESEHKCSECGEFFVSASRLAEHVKVKHPSEHDEKFPCLTCRKFFPSRSRLKTHMNMVHSEKESTACYCEHCGCKQKDAKVLKLHILRVHERERMEEEKKHVCYFCQKKFLTVFELSCHVWTHTLERPFSCHICGKDWNQKHCLTSHLKKHKEDGTFFPKPPDPEELEKEKRFQKYVSQTATAGD